MNIKFSPLLNLEEASDWLVLFVPADSPKNSTVELPPGVTQLLDRMDQHGELPQKLGETKTLYGLNSPLPPRVLIVGLGTEFENESADLVKLFATAARIVCDQPDRKVSWMLPKAKDEQRETQLQLLGIALETCWQTQALYQAEKKKYPLQSVTVIGVEQGNIPEINEGLEIGKAINLTREVINRSPSEITPVEFASRAQKMAEETGLSITILDEQQLSDERMNSLLCVAKGSDLAPRVVKLEHRGGGDAPFIGLVGKGVTYDSGGLSLKPSDSQKTMKSDMSGAATVLGVMQAIAALKLPINVRGYMGLVENMISGRSYRLGDVLTARNGVTIEVHNTDAEGRLVLADVLAYAVDDGCEKLIDLATLTGACVVALGNDYAGVFTNDQSWADQLFAAGKTSGEKMWQFPMCDSFNEQLKSDVADCKNVGTRWGGAITAAKFLEKFVSETPWIHLDIAGPAFLTDTRPEREGGASGVMIRTLLQLLENQK